jgi:hypothetical protein
MNDSPSFQRFAAIAATVSFPLALASALLSGMVTNFSPDVANSPVLMLSAGTNGANLIRWGMILDMMGNYLPILPIALFMYSWLRLKRPVWLRFFTVCGLGFGLIGAVGAVALAAVQPPLTISYAQASADQRAILEIAFGSIWNIIYGGVWNILGELLAGIWFLGVGSLLRSERQALGIAGMVVGACALLDSLSNMLGLEGLAMWGLLGYIILAPVWASWFGIDLLRRPVQARELEREQEYQYG